MFCFFSDMLFEPNNSFFSSFIFSLILLVFAVNESSEPMFSRLEMSDFVSAKPELFFFPDVLLSEEPEYMSRSRLKYLILSSGLRTVLLCLLSDFAVLLYEKLRLLLLYSSSSVSADSSLSCIISSSVSVSDTDSSDTEEKSDSSGIIGSVYSLIFSS